MDYEHCAQRQWCHEAYRRECPGCAGPKMVALADHTLGILLCNWHSSQWDPIYATGSSILAKQLIPELLVKETMCAIERLLAQAKGRREKRELRVILAGLMEGTVVEPKD